MSLSIIVPVYNEEENLIELYERLTKAVKDFDYEIIFVDDGSRDNSYKILKDIYNQDKRVKIVKLKRNFGQIPAILAGIKMAKKEVIITLDADLQNPPEEIHKFVKKIKEGYDIVFGYRMKRKDYFLRKFCSFIFWKLISLKTKTNLKDPGCGFNAIKKGVVEKVLKKYGENIRNAKVLLMKETDSFCQIGIRHSPRYRGKSKYGFFRLLIYSFYLLKESFLFRNRERLLI